MATLDVESHVHQATQSSAVWTPSLPTWMDNPDMVKKYVNHPGYCLLALRFVYLVYLAIQAWSPVVDLFSDLLTVYLYFMDGDFNYSIISLVIVLYSLRNQFVYYVIISTDVLSHGEVELRHCMSTGDIKWDVLSLIPCFGPSIICTKQCLFENKDDELIARYIGTACGCFAELFYITFGAIIGIFVIFYVVILESMTYMRYIKDILKPTMTEPTDEQKATSKKRKTMFLILKFVETLTESLPQLGLQTYIFITQDVYVTRIQIALFYVSVGFSALAVLKLLAEMVRYWNNVQRAFEKE